MANTSYIAKLKKALSSLGEDKELSLDDDIFLCGDLLDGSDKVYGFKNSDGTLLAITRGSHDGFPIDELDKTDLNYIFKGSKLINGSSIVENIKTGKYTIE